MLKLLIIRHGETYHNFEKRFSGHQDSELNEKGIWQAERLAERLAECRIQALYSSDLKRAIHTASIINQKHQLTLNIEPLFKEIHFGKWEGLCYEEVDVEDNGAEYRDWWNKPYLALPGGESIAEVKERVSRGIDKIIAENNSDNECHTVAIVCHGGVAKIMVGIALNIPLDKIWYIRQHSTALNIILYEKKNTYYIELINDISHLQGKAMVN